MRGMQPRHTVVRRVMGDQHVEQHAYVRVHCQPKRFPAVYAYNWKASPFPFPLPLPFPTPSDRAVLQEDLCCPKFRCMNEGVKYGCRFSVNLVFNNAWCIL